MKPNFLCTLAAACLISSAAANTAPGSLPKPLIQSLKDSGIPTSNVALLVQDADGRLPLIQHNGSEPMNPASVMKLLTTYAALEILGPAHTWRTEAFATNTVNEETLGGDLYLKGSGDPRLTFEQFWLLLRQLRAQGIRDIRGDLVLDRLAINPNGGNGVNGGAPFDDQPLRPYNVKPDALLLNWKSVRLTLFPEQEKLAIRAEPHPANLYIISQVTLINGECGNWRERMRSDASEHPGRTHLIITGKYPRSCGEQRWNIGVMDHPQYVYGVFRQLWEELGGTISGTVRDAPVPAAAVKVASIESPPLSELIRDINKFSNNVMARQLYLTLGNGTQTGAESAVRQWLAKKSISLPALVMDNGSGLSRTERITADGLAALLASAWKSPYMPEFVASLPITGIDGTLKKRLKDDPSTGQGHIKTGTLEGVKTMAGYVRDKNGKWQIVVFMINHANAGAAQGAQDVLLQWLAER